MTEGENRRFVPSGVDAETWLGFEQRVQERRFRALLETMRHAIDVGNTVDARIALEEARELRPNAPELEAVEQRLAILPIPPSESARPDVVRARTVSAAMLLLVGVTLLTGLEWIRSARSADIPEVTSPDMSIATPVPTADTNTETAPVTIVPPPPADEIAEPAAVSTTGSDRVIRAQPVALPQPTLRSASTLTGAVTRPVPPRPAPTGEIPDDYVFTPVASSRALARGTQSIGGSRTPLNVTPPGPAAPRAASIPPVTGGTPGASRIVASVAPSASITPSAPLPSVTRRNNGDETQVAAVLNQYARAYAQLDAGAARQVWPTVNERALARAFAGLASQDVEFDDCEIDVHGVTANASCRGTASYVGKVGSGVQRTEARTWRFELRRDGDAWKIETAEARRQ